MLAVLELALFGCATMGNMGAGSFVPRIKVGTELVPLDKSSGLRSAVDDDYGRHETTILRQTDIYVDSDRNMVKRYLIIRTQRLDADFFWKATDYSDPSVIEHGTAELGGKRYEYHSRFTRTNVSSHMGYTFPKCFYQGWWERDVTSQLNVQIGYAEDVTQFGVACGDFSNQTPLADNVKEYIKAFNQRSSSAFQVLP